MISGMTDWARIAREASRRVAELVAAGYTAADAAAALEPRRDAPARPAPRSRVGAGTRVVPDPIEAAHLASGLLTEADVVEAAAGRLEIARFRAAGVEDRCEAAGEAAKVAREAVDGAASR
jgi:hypothetical protein